jgi:succinoglycan biosynthesis transport protein ExoP
MQFVGPRYRRSVKRSKERCTRVQQQGPEPPTLEQALRVLRRRLPLIALCTVVVAAAAYAYSKHETRKYSATASLAFDINPISQQIAGLPANNAGNLLAQEANNVELVKLGDMAEKTAKKLGHGLTAEQVRKSLSIGGQGESSVVDVSATTTSPALASSIVNTYVQQFVDEQQGSSHRYFKSALALVEKELGKLSREQRLGQDGLALQNRAQTLGLLADLKYGSAQVAQEASTPTVPSSPNTKKSTILGGVLGLLIGLGLAFLLERLDGRVREPEALQKLYRSPLLGAVPKSAALAGLARGKAGAGLPTKEAEAFSLIRAHLRSFNSARSVRAVVVGAAAPGDGASTVARHLAEAAARTGSRVLLLEADLRHPTLSQRFGIQSGRGLASVLAGAVSMDEAIQTVGLSTSSDGQTLDVLSAGAALANPGALIESHAMESLLERTKAMYDLVVIDTPPLTVVSDAFVLLRKVDGVVVVGFVGRSRRGVAERLHEILERSGAPLLGVVANGSRSSGRSSYAAAEGAASGPLVASSSNGAASAEELAQTANV